MMLQSLKRGAILLAMVAFVAGCTAAGGSNDDKRRNVENMRKEVLAEIYDKYPKAQKEVQNAPGYAVFSNKAVYVIFDTGGTGYGVVVDNVSNAHTYMRMGAGGGGLGLGYKDWRAVYIFDKRHIMDEFIARGINVGGQASAAAKASTQGDAVGGELLLDGIKVYQLIESGVAAQATVQAAKYWKDPDLN